MYKEVAGLSGLDFAYADNTAVYHTKVFFLSSGYHILFGESIEIDYVTASLSRSTMKDCNFVHAPCIPR